MSSAARELRPTFDESGGRDGFISFECTPDLADDGIVGSARPAERDDQGPRHPGRPADDRGADQAGVNVNVTLLFSIERYEQVIDAYLRGLAARAEAGEPLGQIASVASFFLSRIDGKVDEQLPDVSPLRGQAAIASARVAYQRYLGKFAGDVWERLEARAARRQRPLWASTGTKNPAYSDTRYVAELIGPDVVNTMPDHTLRAFADHARWRARWTPTRRRASGRWAMPPRPGSTFGR